VERVSKLGCEAGWNSSLVQILVVVATIQERRLKTDEEKGSARRAIHRGLAGPKPLNGEREVGIHSHAISFFDGNT